MAGAYYEYKVGLTHQVEVTYVNDPKSFFVRWANYTALVDLIEKPGSGRVSAKTMRIGKRIVYKSLKLKKLVRGEVQNIRNINGEEMRYDIYAIDYGCIDEFVSLSHIHPLDSSVEPINQCSGLATHCRLHLCEPRGETFSMEVIDTMKQFVGEHTATIKVISKMTDQLVVELRTVDCPQDVATMLGLIDLTTFTQVLPSVNRLVNSTAALNLVQTLKFKHKQLNVGDIFHVRVQSGTSVSGFYVADINDFKILKSAQSSFSQYCKSLSHMKDEDFVPGRPCGVKLNNLDTYERAVIKKVNSNSSAVLELVDWGKEIESGFSSIRLIDKDFFLTQPIIAIFCSTDEDQVWTTLPEFFLKGFKFGIKIMELGNNSDKPHKVNIYPLFMLKY